MKRLFVLVGLLVLFVFPARSQAQTFQGSSIVAFSGTPPSGSCGGAIGSGAWSASWLALATDTGLLYGCVCPTTCSWTALPVTSGVPSGSTIAITTGTCPSGYTENDNLAGLVAVGTTHAAGNVGGTGGSSSYTPAGTNSTPTFSGAVDTTSAVSAGTPAGTNSSGGFSEGAISWPVGVPTNASGAFTEGALSWPAGVPAIAAGSFVQPTFAGNALATHTHTLTPTGTNGTAAWTIVTGGYAASTTHYSPDSFGGSALASGTTSITVPAEIFSGALDTSSAVSAGTPAGTNSGGSFTEGAITWPAGVPTIASGTFTQPTVSWPAGVPTIALGSFTQPTFAGNALATHTHTLTPTGTVSTPSFSGTPATITPPYILVIWCSKT